MEQVQRVKIIAGCSAILCSSMLHAAEPILFNRQTLISVQQFFNSTTPDIAKSLISNEPTSFKAISNREDQRHISHKRFQQYYLGFPVIGAQAIIHSQTKNIGDNNAHVSGIIYSGLERDLGHPSVDFKAKGKQALDKLKSNYEAQDISDEQITELVFVDLNNKAHWGYKVSFMIQSNVDIPQRPTAIIDAETLKPFKQWDNIKSNRVPAKGRGYGGNKSFGVYMYGDKFPLLSISRDESQNQCYLENSHTKVVDMQHMRAALYPLSTLSSISSSAMQFSCLENQKLEDDSFLTGNNGYDEVNGAYSPSNDALFFGDEVYFMYKKLYGEPVLTNNGVPMKLVMRVHYGMSYENAFWDGKQMTFGDGANTFHPMVSLGITAHEISHGFTEQHSGLAYYGQSGAIDESFSDMASQVAEAFVYGAPTWKIGSELFKYNFGVNVLRYMDNPRLDGSSIDHASQYIPGMNPHYSSGVYNRLFYLISIAPGWDVKKAFHVMMTANMDYWTPLASFNSASCGILYAAEDLEYQTNAIKLALDEVGVSYDSCNNNPINI